MSIKVVPGTLAGIAITAIAVFVISSGRPLLAAQEFQGERWAVVIGVSEYENNSLTLPYADRDAEEFYKLLLSPEGGAFPQNHVKKLINKQLTLNSIRSALGTFLIKRAKMTTWSSIFPAMDFRIREAPITFISSRQKLSSMTYLDRP